ncbi:Transmembrane protein [Quillaja saponaria]|uniref:Transmembrane protein n=1 Tax=Quillaja saponaria TaxID=32244 RepID=A0AAD7VM30_QUISA|nr:Transmembrane protein [Quillaja saponaria]
MCSRWWWYYTSSLRWPEFDFSFPSSIFRWPLIDFSYFTTGWNLEGLRWFNFSIVDDVLWSFVTALESIALVAMLCYFFVFCGCTL